MFFDFAMGTSQSQPAQSQSMGFGVASSMTGVGTAGLGGSFGLFIELTNSPPATMLGVGSSIGIELGPQATSFSLGLSAENPFRSSVTTQGSGSAAGTVPLFKWDNGLSAPELAQHMLDRELNLDPEAQQRQDLSVNDLTSMKNAPVAVPEACGVVEKRKAEDKEVQTSQNKKARLEESPAP